MKSKILVLAVALLAGPPADAHGPQSRHGGRIVNVGPYHAELVARDRTIDIFLLGHDDKPVGPKGFKGVAILNVEGKAERITLAPSEKNALSGTAATALPANPIGAVQLTAPDGKTAMAKFD